MGPTEELGRVFTVSQTITLCNGLLADLVVATEGEISGFSISRGTFIFFDLKDEEVEAKLGCFMMAHQLGVPLEDGMRVVVYARPGIHQKSGQFRLTVLRVELKGEGSLKRSYELLRKKLETEGLFASERKRLLPRYPQNVGIVSSSNAAGYGDFLTIALARMPGVRYILANVAVQGKDAESEIVRGLDQLNSVYVLDAIVLIRGGGSLEDLQAFNSEPVARAIVRSRAPVVVGVGHERDVTIADFCADVRAATPSNAAQILLPSRDEVRARTVGLLQGGHARMMSTVQNVKSSTVARCERLQQLLIHSIRQRQQAVVAKLKTINALSPEHTLQRGYSLTWSVDGNLITSLKEARMETTLVTQFKDGTINSAVKLIK